MQFKRKSGCFGGAKPRQNTPFLHLENEMTGGAMEKKEYNVLGKVTRRKDGVARVTGREQYSVDVILPRMLVGRVVASPYAHARIKSVDTSAAEAMGAICLTFNDIPHVIYNERIVTVPAALHKDHYVLADKVRRMGEAVAAVAAETEELAEQAARAVQVEYEPLPVLIDPEKSMAPDAEPLYENVMHGGNELKIENNIATERHIVEGDLDSAFAEADVFVEGTFKTPKIYHMQMEPKSAVCDPTPDGGFTLYATTQSIHNVRIILGNIFNIPLSKIDVRRMAVGGTFGSSIQMNSIIPICTALALKARRPVKMSLTREEDMHDHSKYPSQIYLKLGAKKDGTLVGAEMDVIADIGAHIIQGYSYLGVMIGWLVSLYRLPAIRYHGRAVYTNKGPSCAMQGFGNPQMTFAAESLMDELAKKLDMDPIELRLKNYVGMGDTFWGQGPLVRSVVRSDGVRQLLTEGAEKFGWYAPPPNTRGRYRRGRGMARGFHTSSAGAPQPGDIIDYSGAMVKINQDGSVDIVSALMDHGGGTLEAFAKIVSEALCVPLDKVNVSPAGTRTTVYDVVTHATRGVYAGGGAVLKATQEVKRDLLETAAHYMNVRPDALMLRMDETLGQGLLYVPSIPDRKMTIGEIATRCWTDSWKTIAAVESYRPVNCPPAYVSVFLEVEVDTWTGKVSTQRAVLGSDCGTVINPDLASGQLEGGLSKGAGFALYENNQWDANGQLLSKGYLVDSKVPGINESPCLGGITTHFADTYEPSGPFGAKGIGEAATNPIAAAYANAICNATGVRFYELPITPERILAGLKAKASKEEAIR
jgi:xanthine dehydrogenase molybdenum-binding subunit